ncbi:MAG: hypothetical protein JJE52_06440 [Acidimicrobiia bacterium]|nr:hypothetical protein [Acidimicrobiia bacterium]
MDEVIGSAALWARRVGLIATGATAGGLIVGLWIGADLPVGSLAEWVGGLGTVGALVFAGVQISADLELRRESDLQSAWEMARQIAVKSNITSGSGSEGAGKVFYTRGNIRIRNESSRLIRAPSVVVQRGAVLAAEVQLKSLAPAAEVTMPVERTWQEEPEGGGRVDWFLEWSDLGGRRWRLSGDDGLRLA